MLYLEGLMLHVSRGVHWDSDHIVTSTDDLQAIARESVRCQASERIHIGLDCFVASIDRIASWAIGACRTLRTLPLALLEPVERLQKHEGGWDFSGRLALQEELKSTPFSAVRDAYCTRRGVLAGMDFVTGIKGYEELELARRE